MARQKAPYPSIVHLKLLMDMYIRINKIPAYPEHTTEKAFFEKLTSRLVEDRVVQENSRNLVDKLFGFPFQKTSAQAEGIDTEKLEIFTEAVWKRCNLGIIYPEPEDFYWFYFKETIAPLPEHLKNLQNKRYYKYLTLDERKAVDEFCERKISEIMPSNDYVLYYNMYYWNDNYRDVEIAILTINYKEDVAIVKYTYNVNGRAITKTVQRTDQEGGQFSLKNNTLYLNCVEEDINKQHLRTSLCIAVYDSDYPSLSYLKGTYSSSRQNATRPVAGMLMLEKRNNFQEALNAVRDVNVKATIKLELIGELMMVSDEKLRTLSDLSSSKIYNILEQVEGVYHIGFYKKGSDNRQVTPGVCYIQSSGKVMLKVTHLPVVVGFVDTRADAGDDILVIRNFYSVDKYHYNYTYTLRVIKDKKVEAMPVIRLEGIYSGISEFSPRTGKIILVKDTDNINFEDLLEKTSFERFDVGNATKTKTQIEIVNRLNSDDRFIIG